MARLITAKAAGDILGTSVGRLYELVRTKVLPPGVVVHLGRQIRIDQDALHSWIRNGGQALPGGWRREPND